MRTPRFFITGIICLLFSVQFAFAQNLNTKISITVKDATLPQVLQQIQKKYGYRFSYLNNELPAGTKFSAEIKNKPFAEVLDVLLEQTDLGYKQSNGQIIIKKGFPKNKPKTTTFQQLPAAPAPKTVAKTPEKPAETKPIRAPEPNPDLETETEEATAGNKPENSSSHKTSPATTSQPVAQKTPENPEAAGNQPAINAGMVAAENMERSAASGKTENGNPEENATLSARKSAAPVNGNAIPDSAATAPEKVSWLDKLAALRRENEQKAIAADSVLTTDLHLGIVYPLSTNGTQAYKYVNKVSGHLLIGAAAGLEGVAFAGFGNVEKGYVSGMQFAGFFNAAANSASLARLTANRNQGQAVQGAQFAGFFNLANGHATAAQFAGYMNVAAGNLDGVQFAGFLNIAKNVNGVQGAGYMNLARNVDGAQLAGFLNIADTVSGVQGAGFLNIARLMRGTQVGIINVADSARGIPIGLFNFVNKGGYKRLEVFYSDDLQANMIFKMGVQKFHTMVALGAEVNDNKRWAYGYGFGSEWRPSRVFRINTDLMAYHVIEESFDQFPKGVFRDYELNLLNKFRLLGTFQIAERFAVFAGPTYNVFVSQYQAEGSDQIGSTLPANPFYNRTSAGGTNVKMWIGFNAGFRF